MINLMPSLSTKKSSEHWFWNNFVLFLVPGFVLGIGGNEAKCVSADLASSWGRSCEASCKVADLERYDFNPVCMLALCSVIFFDVGF